MRKFLLPAGLLILFAAEILRVYFIMPFPGSQHGNTIRVAYFLDHYIFFIRLAALLLIAVAVYFSFGKWKKWKSAFFILGMLFYAFLFYMVNYKLLAGKMFYQPRNKILADANSNKVSLDKLVLGIMINNESRAYPLEIIGYHHQVQDSVGGEPVMVTYCTVCRSGRVFSPMVKGKKESFRLVGMDHFNAMLEDRTTGSWWRQATGEAITGPLKGTRLEEIPSRQMSLGAWLRTHPNSQVLQPDPSFLNKYADLAGFDAGTIKSGLEKRDSGSWNFKSWVVGIRNNNTSKAYDWNQLLSKRIIQDSLAGLQLVITVENDNASFHAWNRVLNDRLLDFIADSSGMKDTGTGSTWNNDGLCMDGPLKGEQLRPVQAYQEFWHSWRSFNPATAVYK